MKMPTPFFLFGVRCIGFGHMVNQFLQKTVSQYFNAFLSRHDLAFGPANGSLKF